MSGDSSIVAAKQEYTQQLCNILSPLIYEGFQVIWDNCKEESKALKCFQEKLCIIPKWNQDIIDNEYKRIVTNTDCEWLDKLIEAVFLSNVKVLSTIRIGKTKTINISVPNTKNFIHKCYVETARKMWQDPYLIDDRTSLSHIEIKKNIHRLNLLISDCIEQTIRELIPIQNILESYLNDIDLESNENLSVPEPEEVNEKLDSESDSESNNNENNTENYQDNNSYENSGDLRNSDFFMTEPKIEPDLSVSDGDNIHESTHKDENEELISKNIKISNNENNNFNNHNDYRNSNSEQNNHNMNENSPFFSDSDGEN